MKILFASTPAIGHLDPLLAVVRMVKARGDEALLTTGSYLKSSVEAAGARFLQPEPGADIDFSRPEDVIGDLIALPPGPNRSRLTFQRTFLDMMTPQATTLRRFIKEEQPELVVVDSSFFGATPLFLDRTRERPPIVAVGITVLTTDRPDYAPPLQGFTPARSDREREQYATHARNFDVEFTTPVQNYANAKLQALGCPPLPGSVLTSRHLMADVYLQPSVRGFEYDFVDLPPHVRFIGALPASSGGEPTPDWWPELNDERRRVVLVTQGTVANSDFSALIEPTLAALGDRSDLLVVVTTGRRSREDIKGPIPANALIAEYLDYGAIMPRVDAFVTNGGYGTVCQALRHGLPIVSAGRTEDKAEVGARVAWSGVGLQIPVQRPGVEELRSAINRVFEEPAFRARSQELAFEMASINTEHEVLRVFDYLASRSSLFLSTNDENS